MVRFILLLNVLYLISSCSPARTPPQSQIGHFFVSEAEVVELPNSLYSPGVCRDPLNYIPDTNNYHHTPVRILRINVHVMNNSDSTANFSEEEGRDFIKRTIGAANIRLWNNVKMNLPPGNNTPAIIQRYRYQLTPAPGHPESEGIYFHYDDELYYLINRGKKRNYYNDQVYEKYGLQKDSVVNIFLMAHHVDSLKSPTYRPSGNGVGMGPWVKLVSWFHYKESGPWEAIKLLNHEIGHCLSLRHSWRGGDGCDDTPIHPNCWSNTGEPPCDSFISNNVMDYNASMSAWSPCQIGRVHYSFSNKGGRMHKMLEPVWCELNEEKNISIEDTVIWDDAKDLEGHLIIKKGGELRVLCRLSMPIASKIVIHPGGKLILDGGILENNCGGKWQGIEIYEVDGVEGEFVVGEGGRVKDAVHEVELRKKEGQP